MVTGHHHISMYTKDLKENNRFYTVVLGLRRVKISINQNDPSMYHIFYGDKLGSRGNDLTFFDMPYLGRRHDGTDAHGRIGLFVPDDSSLSYWQERLDEFGFHTDFMDFYGYSGLGFEDPDGLRLILLSADDVPFPRDWQPWTNNTVNDDHLIQGMGPVEIKVRQPDKMVSLLTGMFGFNKIKEEKDFIILRAHEDDMTGEIIVSRVSGDKERPGRGTIHHLAIQMESMNLDEVDKRLKDSGYRTTGVIDRFYFDSLYFREGNGVMLEIVGPETKGFTADREEARLGMTLDLPPFLEDRRDEIESRLKPIENWI